MAKDLKKFAHPSYVAALPDWTKIRHCFDGERAIKNQQQAYLPQLKAQTAQDYDNYRMRALFFPIVGKTATSMVGLATTKPPKVDAPSLLAKYFKDDDSEYSFTETYVGIFLEVILQGRYGILIDGPEDVAGDPVLSPYIAENIVNWSFAGGQLSMLLLKEHASVQGDSKFETKVVCRYRHCYIDVDGVYKVEVLNDDLEPTQSFVPTFSGQTIDYIPFVPFGASGIHMSVDKQPMLDIATINVSHYMTSADLEWGRHIVGLPTPVISGVDSSTSLSIGGTAAWILPPAEAKAYFLEFQGQGLASLEHAMTEKIGLMSSMSARLVDNSTRGSEAAETVRLRYMSESASLIHIITSVENGCNILYNMLARLKKAPGSVLIKFSREVLGVGITFKDLKTMYDAYFLGGLSKRALLYNLRRLDAVDPNRTDEEELAAIADPVPPAPPAPPKPAGTSPSAPTPPTKD